MPDFRRR